LWKDIQDAVLENARQTTPVTQKEPFYHVVPVSATARNRKGVASFLNDNLDVEEKPMNPEEDAEALEASIIREVKPYKVAIGCPLSMHDNGCNGPLDWWRKQCNDFPNVWKLEICILCIPATSEPAERDFSAAANVVNKKRIRLDPDTVDLLIYLRGNSDFVEWKD
jgi:hypothetical protein